MQLDMAQVYTDFSGLSALRAKAREDEEAALDEVARQFESLFVQMMLKSMRDASFGGGMLDSKQSEFYREMYDKQLAIEMSNGKGMGLADVIKRQLGGAISPQHEGLEPKDYLGIPVMSVPSDQAGDRAATGQSLDATTPGASTSASLLLDGDPERFLGALWPAAEKVATKLGLAPEALLAQAALETGWGKHVIRHRDGSSSHNLFGIKADSRWDGDRVNVSTLEYRDGVALKTRADFRAYASFEQSLEDYAAFLQRNPRYRNALDRTDDPAVYFEALQRAGYATDPRYADKIRRILEGEPVQRFKQTNTEGATAT